MNMTALIEDIIKKIRGTNKSHTEFADEILSTGQLLDEAIDAMETLNRSLKQVLSEKTTRRPEHAVDKDRISIEEFSAQSEKLLQSSIENLEERLSQRILNMLKELKDTTGPVRQAKLKELKEAVKSEEADLSALFAHERIESNIDELGVEETELQGIEKSLSRIRRMREGA